MKRSMYVWYVSSIVGGLSGALLWRGAIDRVLIKAWDGEDTTAWERNLSFARDLVAAGVAVDLWGYCYGETREPVVAARQWERLGSKDARLILDTEAEWEKSVNLSWLYNAAALGEDGITCQGVAIPMLPYRVRAALRLLDGLMPLCPMMYWRGFTPPWDSWDKLIPDWAGGPAGLGWGHPWRSAAVSFYGGPGPRPTLDELDAFETVLAARGVDECQYWEWTGAPEAWWLRMRERNAGGK